MAVSIGDPVAPRADDSARRVTQLALKFGVGVGLVCVVWMVGLQLTGNNGFGPKQLLAQLLVPMVAVASQWQLRRQLKPEKPGLGRALGVGVLTALLAAVVSAVGVMGLAAGAGEEAVSRHRAEVKEIVQAQQREAAKQGVSAALRQQQLQQIDHLTVGNIASSNFLQVLVLGLVLAVPAGIFLRE
ncbi:DUF4199 domain-containing protein [Hymenobacter monticola]|uniref:DUF4199 domain-containing protein n=1 Tax=Hymenobacter monticola TaxID=1705399 RepID=A0ABY4B7W8_9BACT|nr:DUF4199 domain-containing protein [Hymenobacter monticola]UOE33781.1 DUF4199 domain-containing protein [Hymenobacter monticola]